VATRYPNIYPYLGNAKDWIVNAKKQGYKVLRNPVPDSVVVYGPGNGYSNLGHVAVVDSVNKDGTFNVTEMNYKGYDLIDNRTSSMRGVIGFIIPPGSTYHGSATTTAQVADCVTGGPTLTILGNSTTLCMDGVVGVLAMAAGGVLLISAVAIFAVFALKKTGVANKAASLLPFAGGPVGAAVAVAETSKPKPKPAEVQPSQPEQDAAHRQRMAAAKARLSPETEQEIAEARAGRGKKLTPKAKEELSAA
jgi:hypothetical protein